MEKIDKSQIDDGFKKSIMDKAETMKNLVDQGKRDVQQYVDICDEIRFIETLQKDERYYPETMARLDELLDMWLALPDDEQEKYHKIRNEMKEERRKLRIRHSQTVNLDKLDEKFYYDETRKDLIEKAKDPEEMKKKIDLIDDNNELLEQAKELIEYANPKLVSMFYKGDKKYRKSDDSTSLKFNDLNRKYDKCNDFIENINFYSLKEMKETFDELRESMVNFQKNPWTDSQSRVLKFLPLAKRNYDEAMKKASDEALSEEEREKTREFIQRMKDKIVQLISVGYTAKLDRVLPSLGKKRNEFMQFIKDNKELVDSLKDDIDKYSDKTDKEKTDRTIKLNEYRKRIQNAVKSGDQKLIDKVAYETIKEYPYNYSLLDDFGLNYSEYKKKIEAGWVPEDVEETPVKLIPRTGNYKENKKKKKMKRKAAKVKEPAPDLDKVPEKPVEKPKSRSVSRSKSIEKKLKDIEDSIANRAAEEAAKAERTKNYNAYLEGLKNELETFYNDPSFKTLNNKQIEKEIRLIITGLAGDDERNRASLNTMLNGKLFEAWFNTVVSPIIGIKIRSTRNNTQLSKTAGLLNMKFDFGEVKPEEPAAPPPKKPFKQAKVNKKTGTLLKGASVSNAKTFFSYDIHEIFKIIEDMLHLSLSKHAKLSIEALIYSATNEIINQHGSSYSAHGSGRYDDVISAVEDYINQHSKSTETFHFMGQRRQQFETILRGEVKAQKRQKESDMDDRIAALKNFV